MAKSKSKKIKASKELQFKVGTGKIDEKVIKDAQKALEDSKVDFAPLARPDLNKLQKAIDAAREDFSDSDAVMDSIKTPIMNLKANAGSFDYEFVSNLTGMILMFFESVDKPDKKVIQIADVLHKTILLALAYNMSGDGGKNGKILFETFEQICKKYKPST